MHAADVLLPAAILVAARTRSMRWMGESFSSMAAWLLGSPYSTVEIAAIHGSVCSKKVAKLTTPKRSAPAAKSSGYSVSPAMTM